MSHTASRVSVAFSTVPPDRAAEVAERLVAAGSVACVNILPSVRSVYRWKGEICRDEESLLVIKCATERLDAAREALIAAHPYEVPEWIAWPLADAHPAYIDWVLAGATGGEASAETAS